MTLFETASRLKLRFPSTKGDLTVEQLWDLPLQSKSNFDLDTVAKTVNAYLQSTGEKSFVTASSTANEKMTLTLDIVKHIISVRLKENQDALLVSAKKAEREKLLGILANKQDEALQQLTPEQIQARLAELS